MTGRLFSLLGKPIFRGYVSWFLVLLQLPKISTLILFAWGCTSCDSPWHSGLGLDVERKVFENDRDLHAPWVVSSDI